MRMSFYFLLMTGFIFFSCRDHHVKRLKSASTSSNAVTKDIPEWYSQTPSKKIDDQIRKSLGIESLENGFDSLQIRIWISCGYDTSSLILLEKVGTAWNAVFYWYRIDRDDENNWKATDIQVENRSPNSSWKNFSDSLIKTGITDLLDQNELPSRKEFFMPTDAAGVTVEVGMAHKYRIYGYTELGFNSHIKDGPGKLHQAVKLIEGEFNYKRPCQDSAHIE